MSNSLQANGNGDLNGWLSDSDAVKGRTGHGEEPPKMNGMHSGQVTYTDAEGVGGVASREFPKSDEENEGPGKKLLSSNDYVQSPIAPALLDHVVGQEMAGTGELEMDGVGSLDDISELYVTQEPTQHRETAQVDASSPVGNGNAAEMGFTHSADIPIETVTDKFDSVTEQAVIEHPAFVASMLESLPTIQAEESVVASPMQLQPPEHTAVPQDIVAAGAAQKETADIEQDAVRDVAASQGVKEVVLAPQGDDAGLHSVAAATRPAAVSEAPPVANTTVPATKAPAGLGLGVGLGLRLPPRALRPSSSNPQGVEQSQNTVESSKDEPPPVAASAAVFSITQPALSAAYGAPIDKASAEQTDVRTAGQAASVSVQSQPAAHKLPRPSLPARPGGFGSVLPPKVKPAVAKRAKAQSFTAALKPSITSSAESQPALPDTASMKQEEELKAAKAEALKNARLVEKLSIKHATKVQEYQHLSSMVLQELKYLQAYHRQNTALAHAPPELSALIEAGNALSLGARLGRIKRYVGNSGLVVGGSIKLPSLIDVSEKRGFKQLHQAVLGIRDGSATQDVTLGCLLQTLAHRISPGSDVNQTALRPSDRPIEEVVDELDKAVKARTLLEQQQLLQHLQAKDWSKSFRHEIEIPKQSVLAAAFKLLIGLPLLPFRLATGLLKKSNPSSSYIIDQERFETRLFVARLKLLQAYQQAVCEQAGVLSAAQ